MALPEIKQAETIIRRAHRLLLLVPEQPDLDAIASMVACYVALQDTHEDGLDEVSPSHVPKALQFLAGSSQVRTEPQPHAEVTLDLAGPTEILNIRTTPLQGGVRIHLTLPANTTLSKSSTETSIRSLPYDAAIIFGAADLEAIGSIFTSHTDFFYNTPIINIDHRASNEHYGTINLVDITAGSIAEVTLELIRTLTNQQLEEPVATALYAGIIAGTDSFQSPSTTPRSFHVAAQLIEHHANRDAVIQHLVKTKPLPLLKLTGRLYARLRVDEHIKLFWTVTRPPDFTESEASPSLLSTALAELANNIAGFNAAFVLHEKSDHVFEVLLLLGKGLAQQQRDIAEQLNAERTDSILKFPITAPSLDSAEEQVVAKMRQILPT